MARQAPFGWITPPPLPGRPPSDTNPPRAHTHHDAHPRPPASRPRPPRPRDDGSRAAPVGPCRAPAASGCGAWGCALLISLCSASCRPPAHPRPRAGASAVLHSPVRAQPWPGPTHPTARRRAGGRPRRPSGQRAQGPARHPAPHPPTHSPAPPPPPDPPRCSAAAPRRLPRPPRPPRGPRAAAGPAPPATPPRLVPPRQHRHPTAPPSPLPRPLSCPLPPPARHPAVTGPPKQPGTPPPDLRAQPSPPADPAARAGGGAGPPVRPFARDRHPASAPPPILRAPAPRPPELHAAHLPHMPICPAPSGASWSPLLRALPGPPRPATPT